MLLDTIVPDPLDSVILILKQDRRKGGKCQQIAAEIKARKLLDAEASLADAKAENGGVLDNYCKLLNVLLDLEKVQESCMAMIGDKETRIRDVALQNTLKGCAQAKALLDIAFNEQFYQTLEWFTLSSQRTYSDNRTTEAEKTPSIKDSEASNSTVEAGLEFRASPNPFSNTFTLIAFVPDNSQSAELLILDVLGQELMRLTLQKGHNRMEVDASKLKDGLL